MTPAIRLISTDFDGTLFAEFENPPVPEELQRLIGRLQAQGAHWVINTGRDMSSLMETLGRAHLAIRPDFLVLVEREIYRHEASRYVGVEDWNRRCHEAHTALFARVRPDLPRLVAWIDARFDATVYADAEAIHAYLDDYCREIPDLAVVRNDVYARFSHTGFSKGTALAEIGRRLGVEPEHTLAAGDHLNDLPMLARQHARLLVAPANAVEAVRAAVLAQGGFLSDLPCGAGLAQGLRWFLGENTPKRTIAH
jgi:HAD superfamily hydrolase (TIGR01484 family)